MKISQIISGLQNNQLFVPVFQREYVWKRENVKSLFDSLIKDYPFGTMLTWDTNKPPKMKGPVDYHPNMGSVKLILDGQQRITSLYLIITGELPPYYQDNEIMVDTRGLYVNLLTTELQYYKPTIMEKDPMWFNLTQVFNDDNLIKKAIESATQNNPEAVTEILNNHVKIRSILNRDFVEQVIPIQADIKDAIDIFYTVNTGGITLTDAELALAQISGYWEEARDLFKTKIHELEEQGFEFKLDFIVYCLLAIMHQSGDEMKKLHGRENKERLQEVWKNLDKYVLDYVINIIRNKAFVDHTDEINSVYALIPIITYYYKKFESGEKSFSNEEIKKIIRWFYFSQIRNRYVSQLPQKLTKDTKIAWESQTPFETLLSFIEEERSLTITSSEFEGRNVSHPLFRLMLFYLKSKGAVCLTTKVPIHQTMGKMYKLERDHIFPFSVLKKIGYGMGEDKYRLAQEFTNRAILTQIANRNKSNKSAVNYLSSIDEESLKLQSIPTDRSLWELEKYEDFLQERRQMLTQELNKFLDSFLIQSQTQDAISIESLVQQGESDELEFKSTFQYNLHTQKADKALVKAILKTIAAFTNTDGGTLLIGVDNKGQILGLDPDYNCLIKGQDKDMFEVVLRNAIEGAFSNAFSSRRLEITFPVIDEKEICRIDIQKNTELLFLQSKDANGTDKKEAFIRVGNASKVLDPSDISNYSSENF